MLIQSFSAIFRKAKGVRGVTGIGNPLTYLKAGGVVGNLKTNIFNSRFVFLPSGQFHLPNLMPLHILLGSPGTRCPDTL